MDNAIYIDVVVTWLGAIGCALYCGFVWRQDDVRTHGIALFLFGILTYLLAIRGVYWLFDTPSLARLVFAGATLLPLGVVLYTERLLRRHAPFALKVFALAATAVFFSINLVYGVADSPALLIGFLSAFVVVGAWVSVLLLRAHKEELTVNETRRARVMVIVAFLALPLVISDFRTELPQFPVRLGAIGALVCVYVLLRVEHGRAVIARAFSRLGVIVSTALLLAAVIGVTSAGMHWSALTVAVESFPPALAWMLLTGIWVRIGALEAETRSQSFARWLLRSRLDSVAGFVASLKHIPLMQQHVLISESDLKGYDLPGLCTLATTSREPLSVGDARRLTKAEGRPEQAAAEQLLDLLERFQMTHALFISTKPVRLLLVNLPEGAEAAIGRLHAGIIQKLAQRLSEST